MSKFTVELEALVNKYSQENDSDTPDFLLAEYLDGCLKNFSLIVRARDKWWGFTPWGEPEPNETISPPKPQADGGGK